MEHSNSEASVLPAATLHPCYRSERAIGYAHGKIAVPPEIEEGSRVTILAADDEEPVALSSREEEQLSEAMAQIDSGHDVDGWALLEELKAQSWESIPTKSRSESWLSGMPGE